MSENPTDQPRGRPPQVMIAVHNGFSIRYLLQTEIFTHLRALGAEIVILIQGDVQAITNFAGPGIRIDGVPNRIGNEFASKGRLQRALRFIRHFTFGDWVQTLEDHLEIARKDAELDDAPFRLRRNMWLLRTAIMIARRSRIVRRAILKLESRLFLPEAYARALQQHKADLLVTSSLGTFDYDYYIMRAARRLNLATASVILSWDNTTTRGYPGAESDYVMTWTETMRDEAARFCDVPYERITVGGIAHFDHYFRDDPKYDRTEFLRGLGLDATKRMILFVTKSPNGYAYNPNIAKILGDAITDGRFPPDVQVLVRVHPIHYRYIDGELVYDGAIKAFHQIARENPSVVINEPQIQSSRVNSDMAQGEIQLIARLIRSSDLIVNIFSTLNLEGAIYDRPLVNVCFEDDLMMYEGKITPRFDIGIDYRATHNQRLIRTGGVRLVYSPDEMIEAIQDYISDPSLDHDGRQRIVDQETGPHNGRAGQFIAEALYRWAAERADASSGKNRASV